MSLSSNDIKLYKPANISDTSSNGGVITSVELLDVVGALFANVDNTERTTGSTKWRKLFFKIHNDGIDPLVASRVFLDKDTTGSDTILFVPGTKTDIQSGINSSFIYGNFPLSASVSSGSTSLITTLPAGITNPFYVGETIRVTNKPTVNSAGDEDFVTVTVTSGTTGAITLTFSPALNSSYTASNTTVAGVYEYGDLGATATDLVDSSAGGTFDISQILCNNRGTINDVWTISFTSATTFNMTASCLTTPVAGNIIAANFSITNPTYSAPYFTIPNTAFSGTFATSDTFNFTTHDATIGLWINRIVPANSTPTAVNKAVFVLDGGTI